MVELRRKGKKLNDGQPVWQEGIGSLLRLSAAQQTGLLERVVTTVMGIANLTMRGCTPLNPVVVDRLLRTLLFLPVAGLARSWDLRSYTGTMLASLSGRECAYSQGYTERFLARLAQAGGAECLTEAMARWTCSLWQTEQPSTDQTSPPAVFYVDGHRKAVYSAVLVPRGPVGKLDGKILGCRELVLLHDAAVASTSGNHTPGRPTLDDWTPTRTPLLPTSDRPVCGATRRRRPGRCRG